MPAPVHKRRLTAFAVAMAVLIVTPLAVAAADRFDDVPNSNIFHDDINAIAEAGVTLGCNPPDNDEYCPSDNVTREQMAAFMNRLGALEPGQTPVANAATALEANHATEADHASAADTADDSDSIDGIDSADLLPGGTTPAGTTISGTYVVDFLAAAAGGRGTTSFAFGYRLEGSPIAHFVAQGDPPPAECPGSPEDPQAAEGHLCVFEAVATNSSTACVVGSTPYLCDTADEFGGGVFVSSAAGGITRSVGSWAVTVPELGVLSGEEPSGIDNPPDGAPSP